MSPVNKKLDTYHSVPIFLIELENSTRSKVIKSQLKTLNKEFTIQRAIKGSELSTPLLEKVDLGACKTRLGYEISPQLIGSGLSHMAIYDYAIRQKLKWIMVLEEDVKIEFEKFFETDLIQIIKRFESVQQGIIIQLFSRGTRLTSGFKWKRFGNHYLFRFLPRLIGSGAPAYLINDKALAMYKKIGKLEGAPA